MNVILVSPLPPPAGGIASWTENYLNSEQSNVNNIVVVDSSVDGKRKSQILKRNIYDEICRVFRIQNKINKLLLSDNYEILHYNSSCSNLGMIKDIICLNNIRGKVKVVLHLHCDTGYIIKGILSNLLFRKLCSDADKIICLNKSSYSHIKNTIRKDPVVIPNFIALNENYIKRRSISESIKKIIFVGNIIPSKGCYEFFEVAKNYPEITFKLVGSYNPHEYSKFNLPNVVFVGQVSKNRVIDELNDSDLLLFPSHTEGFPLVILEAMSVGLPIVATSVGAIPDMIENYGGKLVNVSDVEAMVSAIKELQDMKKREKISEWNINKVLEHYTLENIMSEIYKVYKEIL